MGREPRVCLNCGKHFIGMVTKSTDMVNKNRTSNFIKPKLETITVLKRKRKN